LEDEGKAILLYYFKYFRFSLFSISVSSANTNPDDDDIFPHRSAGAFQICVHQQEPALIKIPQIFAKVMNSRRSAVVFDICVHQRENALKKIPQISEGQTCTVGTFCG